MGNSKQINDMIKTNIEIGVILQSKYKESISKIDDYTIVRQADLCMSIYYKWVNISESELKVPESKGYISEFMNNETDIVNRIISTYIF